MTLPLESSEPPRPRRKPVRRNPHQTVVRWNSGDYAKLLTNAENAGMSVSSYIRSCVLEAPTTRMRRRPSVDVFAVTKLLAAVHKAGVNLHQIAKHLNFGGTPVERDLREVLSLHRAVCAAILAELGRKPQEGAP